MQAEGVLNWVNFVAERTRLRQALRDVYICCGVERGVCSSASEESLVMIAS